MRCCPFAEGNSNVHSSMLANMAGVQNPLYSSMAAAASRPIYPVYATPPRHVQLRAAPPLLLTAGVSGMAGPNDMLQNQMLHFPMPTAPQMLPGFPALQSPFGPVISTAAQAPYGHSITSHASPDAYASGQAEIDKREGATFLYDSGYGRYPHEHEKHASVQETKIVEIDRPITPSPTGSQSSGCSFAFSSSSAPDADSPTTSIDSNGSTSSASSPETLSKAIRTPPSSKFRGFDDSEKRSEMKHVRLEHSCDDAIEEGLRKLRM